ncbi:MAG: hypothetical protein E1N59_2574 [Puniceicoccaceae bacterium 5H]|nr:MAG: hypothetical protein E1N59_2574 [Puniceicoccaceae bacterium 5H]
MRLRPPCPWLPPAYGPMSYRDLNQLGTERGPIFFLTALRYGQYLWQRHESARAILALARGLYADLDRPEAHPLPYGAIGWIVHHHPGDTFIGNPRISFQHQAERYRGSRARLRCARSWAAWQVVRMADPDLPGDPHPACVEPTAEAIEEQLANSPLATELNDWQRALRSAPHWQPEPKDAPTHPGSPPAD